MKSILVLCQYATGFAWTCKGEIIPGLEPQPSGTQAVRHLTEMLSATHLIHWPKETAGKRQRRRKAPRLNVHRLSLELDTELANEIAIIAQLHRTTPADAIRRVLLHYYRPKAPQPLPVMTPEYIQSLLEQHRQGNLTMPPTHRKSRAK